MSKRPLQAHLYERLRDYTRSAYPNPAQIQEVRAIIHREHVLAGGTETDPECPNCIDMRRRVTHDAGDGCDPPHGGMRKIKVRITGLGRAKTLTYQTAQDVALDQEVEVPRWPGMKPGPPLRGIVVALTSDREGPLTTIVGG